MAFVNKVNGIPIDDFLAVNPNYTKAPALDKYGNPYLFEDGTPQYTVIPKSDEEVPTVDPFSGQQVSAQDQSEFLDIPDQVKSYIASLSSAKDKQDVIDLYRRKPVSVDEVPTVDPFSGQQVSAQDQEVIENINKRLDYLKSLDPNYLVPGSAGGMVLEDAIAGQQETLNDILNKYTNQPTNFPTIDPFSGRPYLTDPNAPVQPVGPAPPDNYYDEVPTVDPFSGEQVSAQDQAAFTQQQDIFPEQSRGLDYLTGMPDSQPVSQLGRQGILNLLTSNFGDLDFQTINELRNNPDAFNLSRGSGALTAGSLLPKFIKDFQYAAPQGTDINQLRNLARETASNKSFTDLIKDVYNDPAKFDPDFKPKAGQIKTGYPQYLKEGILSAVGFQPTSQIGGGTDAARALLEKIKSIPGAQTLGKVLPGVGIASGTYDVGSRLSQGDYFGAGLGALSAVPFVGIPAAAAQAAYDYRQPLADMIRNVVYRPGRG